MAFNLARTFSEKAEQGLPDWEVQQMLLLQADPLARSMDPEDFDDIPDEDLKRSNPAVYAMRRAARERDETRDGDRDEAERERDKQQEAAKNNDDWRDAMENAAEIAAKRWDNQVSDFGNLGLTNKQVIERLNDILANSDKYIEKLKAQGLLQNGQEDEFRTAVLQARDRQKRRQELNQADVKGMTPSIQAELKALNEADRIASTTHVGQAAIEAVKTGLNRGFDIISTEVENKSLVSNNIKDQVLLSNQMAETSSLKILPEPEKISSSIIMQKRTFQTNSIPTQDFSKVSGINPELSNFIQVTKPMPSDSIENTKKVTSLNI